MICVPILRVTTRTSRGRESREYTHLLLLWSLQEKYLKQRQPLALRVFNNRVDQDYSVAQAKVVESPFVAFELGPLQSLVA